MTTIHSAAHSKVGFDPILGQSPQQFFEPSFAFFVAAGVRNELADRVNAWGGALADDLNIAGALGVMHPWIKGDPPDPAESLAVWKKMNSVLSIAPINEGTDGAVEIAEAGGAISMEDAQALCGEMDEAKKNKDYDASDAIRKKILDAGFEVQQSPEGSSAANCSAVLVTWSAAFSKIASSLTKSITVRMSSTVAIRILIISKLS